MRPVPIIHRLRDPGSRIRLASLAGLVIVLALVAALCAACSGGAASDAATSPKNWITAHPNADGVYVTLWSDAGVVGCRGMRGALSPRPGSEIARLLTDALAEAALGCAPGARAPDVRRARVTFVQSGRPVAPGSEFDINHEAVLASFHGHTAAILPGEARTPAYAWRKTCRLLALRQADLMKITDCRVLAADYQDFQLDALKQLVNAEGLQDVERTQ